jgi:hypothetical protein
MDWRSMDTRRSMDWQSRDTPAGYRSSAIEGRAALIRPAQGRTGAPWRSRRQRPIMGRWTELSLPTSYEAGARQSNLAMSVLLGGPDDAPMAYAVKRSPS